MINVDVISGFLGAGKTTLIKKLLESEDFKNVVIIENEYGEISIDSKFLSLPGIQIKEINSGCICCTLIGEFDKALLEVIDEYKPQHIIIEPSGVGKLSDIMATLAKVTNIKLNIICTVVDATRFKMQLKNFGEFYENQIENAKTILLSHTESLSKERIEETIHTIKHMNNGNIITTPIKDLSVQEIILALNQKNHDFEEHHHEEHECCHHDHEEHHHEEHECCHHDHEGHHHEEHECCHHDHEGHHHANEIFSSFAFETIKQFSQEELKVILDELSHNKSIIRAKGVLEGKDTWWYFDYISNEYEIRKGEPCYTGQICVIGKDIDSDEIRNTFLKEKK